MVFAANKDVYTIHVQYEACRRVSRDVVLCWKNWGARSRKGSCVANIYTAHSAGVWCMVALWIKTVSSDEVAESLRVVWQIYMSSPAERRWISATGHNHLNMADFSPSRRVNCSQRCLLERKSVTWLNFHRPTASAANKVSSSVGPT